MLGAEPWVQQVGLFGLLLVILARGVQEYYRDNYGELENLRKEIINTRELNQEDLQAIRKRMRGIAVILYRKADEDWENIDEETLREMILDGGDVVFPHDFDKAGDSNNPETNPKESGEQ